MRNALASGTIDRVQSTIDTVELTLSLVIGVDPIRGGVRLPNGEQPDFWGWLELAEIVQGAADGRSDVEATSR